MYSIEAFTNLFISILLIWPLPWPPICSADTEETLHRSHTKQTHVADVFVIGAHDGALGCARHAQTENAHKQTNNQMRLTVAYRIVGII